MPSLYRPRSYFHDFHRRSQRWALLVAHRRAGKTVAVVNDTIEKALYNLRPNPRYAYIAPFRNQAKDIAWTYLKEFSAPYEPKINESNLYVELQAVASKPRITIYGADNPDSFRGLYLDGATLDEFGLIPLSVFKEILLPALIDRRGWCVMMGTPNGPNHFRDMWYQYEADAAWFRSFLPVHATNIIPAEDLKMMQELMDPEQYAQEMLCSFEASVRGAIYARQMEEAEQAGRIGDFNAQPSLPVHAVFDLGFRDLTVGGFFQERPDGIVIDKVFADNLKPIGFYIQAIKEYYAQRRLRMGKIWLPHDAKAKSLQTGRSIIEQFHSAQLRPHIVPELSLLDGIAASRQLFQHIYFNKERTKDHVLALKSYHRKYDEKLKTYLDDPVHDWSSHYADMHRYLSLIANRQTVTSRPRSGMRAGVVEDAPDGVRYPFALDDIWDCRPTRSGRI